jgi:tetratricopeptide (TPR) repeat protein
VDVRERDFGLKQAIDEHMYVRRTCPRDNPFWSNNQAHLALAYAEKGELERAMLALDQGGAAHPSYDGTYLVRAKLLKRAGRKEEAMQTLLRGDGAVQGGSAEINYALGLAYFEAKQYEKSRKYARQAYAQGYPLPGLGQKLAHEGYPL